MRTEQEMYDLIINTAKEDEGILAVYMNGSRSNPNVPRDIFQDYDIGYVVKETKPYYEDEKWIDRFGERLYMQMPDKMDQMRGMECNLEESYGWLIQFVDGNRLDLHVEPLEYAKVHIHDDKLCKILLDKGNYLPSIPESTDEDYHVKRPSREDFLCECNNFWWCMNNVAKGIWRGEIPYVMDMMNYWNRPHLVHLLSWKIGYETKYSCSVGKSGKYMYRYLPESIWNRFLETYPCGKTDDMWRATFTMCDLFDEVAKEVGEVMGYEYNEAEARASRSHLEHVRRLPKDAKEIY